MLVAPPGAGKTTVTPLALLDEPWAAGGKLIVLEPRRLAARAAAARMAATLGEPVGETVGYRVRLASRVSARTRIEVVTEGVFTRMILDDPGLDGVAAVLFDEFHERSLDADLGLAFARDAQRLLRPDLRLLVMSATLDPAPVAALLDDAPIIESQGRMFPVETRYLGRDPALRIEDQVVRAVLRALAEETGSAAGLPARPGRDPCASPSGWPSASRDPAVEIAPLYGALDARRAGPRHRPGAGRPAQGGAGHLDRPDQPDHRGRAGGDRRRPGARAALRPGQRPDAAGDRARLRAPRPTSGAAAPGAPSPASATGCGTSARRAASSPFDRPEILEADLARVALDLARWGAGDGAGLAFLDRRRPPRWPRRARCCSGWARSMPPAR